MEFNSLQTLLIFIPVFFFIYFIAKPTYRKWILLFASVISYAWFQRHNVLIIITLVLLNYLIIQVITKNNAKINIVRFLFIFALIFNIAVLLFFRIFTTSNWFNSNITSYLPYSDLIQKLSYPIGLSFIVFQILSTLIDIHRASGQYSCNFWDYMNYIFMFPKIAMGPITRFNNISPQLLSLNPSWNDVLDGSKRFIIGLAKKVIIADQLAAIVNTGFDLTKPAFPTSIAWLIIVSFMIQIYYDFSGYIDMGIGLAKIMGIHLPENFNSPYLSLNVSEFWRRWHMTLTSWFRDYLFYPLEFSRRKVKHFRQVSHTILVFLLTGLWHGLTINYLIWGVLQGVIISFENSRYGKWIKRMPEIVQRLYFIVMILISWIFFRSNSLGYGLRLFKRLIVIDQNVQLYPFSISQPLPLINNSVILAFIIGLVGLLPIKTYWSSMVNHIGIRNDKIKHGLVLLEDLIYIAIFIGAMAFLTSQKFVPSIYGSY